MDHIQNLVVLQCPIKEGQNKDGVQNAPHYFHENFSQNLITKPSLSITIDSSISCSDASSSSSSSVTINANAVSQFIKKLHSTILDVLPTLPKSSSFLLNIGGDHSLALGSLTALNEWYKGKFAVIWVDAHTDIHTPLSSSTKMLHGCPVSLAMNLEGARLQEPAFKWMLDKGCIEPNQIVYIGLRSVDAEERDFLVKYKIPFYSMFDVEQHGIQQITEIALHQIDPRNELPLHLSFDVDAVDPMFIPSTGTAVEGGLTFREARFIAHKLHRTGRLHSMDLVELNPMIGNEEQVAKSFSLAAEIVNAALGQSFISN